MVLTRSMLLLVALLTVTTQGKINLFLNLISVPFSSFHLLPPLPVRSLNLISLIIAIVLSDSVDHFPPLSSSASSSAVILESYINAVKFRDAGSSSVLASSKSQEEEERRRTTKFALHSEINSQVAQSKGEVAIQEWDRDQLAFVWRAPVVEGETSRRQRSKERLEIVLNCVQVRLLSSFNCTCMKEGRGY